MIHSLIRLCGKKGTQTGRLELSKALNSCLQAELF